MPKVTGCLITEHLMTKDGQKSTPDSTFWSTRHSTDGRPTPYLMSVDQKVSVYRQCTRFGRHVDVERPTQVRKCVECRDYIDTF